MPIKNKDGKENKYFQLIYQNYIYQFSNKGHMLVEPQNSHAEPQNLAGTQYEHYCSTLLQNVIPEYRIFYFILTNLNLSLEKRFTGFKQFRPQFNVQNNIL
jgi:hypothetical protein